MIAVIFAMSGCMVGKFMCNYALLPEEHGNDIEAISICLDASIKDCRRRVTSDSIKWSNICNGNMWQSPILKTLGIATIPGNIICDSKGKIIARDLRADKIEEKIKEVLGKK